MLPLYKGKSLGQALCTDHVSLQHRDKEKVGDKESEIRMNVWLKCDESETGVEQKVMGSSIIICGNI